MGRWFNIKRLILIIILWSAFVLRTSQLAITPGLSGDESFNGADAVRVLEGVFPIFFTDNFGREPLFIYSMAFFMNLLGHSIFAIRFTSVVYAMIGLVFTYVFAKRCWKDEVALLAVGLVSVSFWPVFLSRIGLRAITLPVLETFVLYSYYRGIQTHRKNWLYIGGIGLGLCTYTYIPGRIFPVVLMSWICVTWLMGNKLTRKRIGDMKVVLVTSLILALLVFLPLGLFMYKNASLANQRIEELDWTMDRLIDGDLKPLLYNFISLAKMFFILGDSDVYYNIPFRPIFGMGLGFIFTTGLILCLINIRQPANQLLLVWFSVMLLPSLLTTGGAILRSVGAVTPIYLLPSIAISEFIQKVLQPRSYYAKYALLGILIVMLSTISIRTQHDFFQVWSQLPRVRQVYGAGLSHIGQAMTAMMPITDDTIVMVGCEYAADLCRNMVRFQTRYNGPIDWFKSSEALVIPDTSDDTKEILYFIADNFPLPDAINELLSSAQLLDRFSTQDGTVEAEVFRLPAQQTGNLVSPQLMLGGRFRDLMQMIGYDLPSQGKRGSDLDFVLYWKVPQSYNEDMRDPPRWQVLLDDGTGNYWSEAGGILPYSVGDWSPGEIVMQHITLPIPMEVPPGSWHIQVSMYRQFGGTLIFITDSGDPVRRLSLGTIQILGNPIRSLPENTKGYGQKSDLGLISLDTAIQIAAGSTLLTTVEWQAISEIDVDYQLMLSIHNGSCETNTIYSSTHNIALNYPTTQWSAGEPLRIFYQMKIDPDLPNGDYMFTMDLFWSEQSESYIFDQILCQPFNISGRQHNFTLPSMQTFTDMELTKGVKLLGYDIDPQKDVYQAGDDLVITLYWQTTESITEGYAAFVHIYQDVQKSAIVGQHDSPPCEGFCPTSSWVPEEVLIDKHVVHIPVETKPGQYPVGIGMYDVTTFERLSIPDTEDNVLILTSVDVE